MASEIGQFHETYNKYTDYLKQTKAPESEDLTSLFDRCETTYQQLKTQGKALSLALKHPAISNILNDCKKLHRIQKAAKRQMVPQSAQSDFRALVSAGHWEDVRGALMGEAARIIKPQLTELTSLELALLLRIRNKNPKRDKDYEDKIRLLIASGHRSELALKICVAEHSTEFVQALLRAGTVLTEEIASMAFANYSPLSLTRELLEKAGLIDKETQLNYRIGRLPDALLRSLIQDSSSKPQNLIHCILHTERESIKPLLELAGQSGIQFTHEHLHEAINFGALDAVQYMVACGVRPTQETLNLAIRRKNSAVLDCILDAKTVIPTEEDVLLAISCGGDGWSSDRKREAKGIQSLIRAGAPRTKSCYDTACKRKIFTDEVLETLKPDIEDPS